MVLHRPPTQHRGNGFSAGGESLRLTRRLGAVLKERNFPKGLEVLRAIANSEPRLLLDPVPQVMVASMAESAVNIQLRAWASNDDYWQTYWDLNKRVKEAIEAAGLTIPFPQRSLHLVDTRDLLTGKAIR